MESEVGPIPYNSGAQLRYYPMKKQKPLLRAVALVLLFSFACQDLAMAAGELRLSIPANLGRTRMVRLRSPQVATTSGEPGRTIIHIEDAHDSLEAQRKIVSILDVLAKDYDVRTIALEGGAGEMDTALFKTHPDQALAKQTAEDLVKEGRLNAGEFFALTSQEPISVYGAEEKTLYRENLKAFRDLLKNKEKIEKDLKGLSRSIEVLKERVYSDTLKEMERNKILALEEEKGFTRRWERLKAFALAKNVAIDGYTELKTLDDVTLLEKEIDFAKANDQRTELLEILKSKISKTDSEKLILRSLAFKAGKISDANYYSEIADLASRYGVSADTYPDLARFMKYLSLFESLDLSRVFEELEAFENSVKSAFYATEDERLLARLEEEWNILSHLVSGEASSKEYLSFRASDASRGIFHQDPSTRSPAALSLGMTTFASLLEKYHVPS